jgi:hypothetical protein
MWVVNGIHSYPTNGWAHPTPTRSPGFAEFTQIMFGVANFSNNGSTFSMNFAYFSRAQA